MARRKKPAKKAVKPTPAPELSDDGDTVHLLQRAASATSNAPTALDRPVGLQDYTSTPPTSHASHPETTYEQEPDFLLSDDERAALPMPNDVSTL